MKRTQLQQLIINIGIPLLVGTLSGYLSGNSRAAYQQLEQPSFAPPGWLFPIVWSILFVLMGISSYLIYTSEDNHQQRNKTLLLYGIQLFVNFFWSIIFFIGEMYLFAFIWILLLWGLIFATIYAFYQISKPAAYLLIPYLLWVTFAGYLNLILYLLN